MFTKRRVYLFLLQLPITLIVGIFLYFGYSMRVHEQPQIDWFVAITLGILVDIVLTLINKRDEKHHHTAT